MKKLKHMIWGWSVLLVLSVQVGAESLDQYFLNPPDASRPWCYWYWVNNNISKDGVTKDLEAMAEVGIGTALIGNQYFGNQPPGPVKMLSEEWWEITVHAVREGKRLGVDIGLFNCPGWSQSGGPWIKPEQSMRYITSTEVQVTGPSSFNQILPAPDGDFDDVAVLAFPVSKSDEKPLSARHPEITCSPEVEHAEYLVDGDRSTSVTLPLSKKQKEQQIDIEVSKPFTAQTVVLRPSSGFFKAKVTVSAWVNGKYEEIYTGKYDRRRKANNAGPMIDGAVYLSLPPTASDRFRIEFSEFRTSRGDEGTAFAEIEILSAARVEYAVEKQLGKTHPTPSPKWEDYQWPQARTDLDLSARVDPSKVYDLTDKLDSNGRLTCQIPKGDWVIQRFGMLPTGVKNSPAAPNASGLEVDKMSRKHLDSHFDAFVGEFLKRLTPEEKTAFKYVVADSYEQGSQNWSDDLQTDFEEKYGYDPIPYLPVLSGRVVKSPEASDRFLWDLRRMVADQLADVYAAGLKERSNEHGLKTWLENYGHWGFPGEFMRYGGACDLVAGEFWATGSLGNIECKSAASTAHAYGKKITYAEALTSGQNWELTPYKMKARGDWAFTEGINHFVLHVNIQQPDEQMPGINAWFGTEFNRHNTWYFEGRDWIDYLRRCHVMLQQGMHVGDFAYFIGEDAPIMSGIRQPEQPVGYDFDFINAQVLLERMSVQNGRWTLPDGKSYAVMVLPPLKAMRPEVLNKFKELVAEGGTLYGEAPDHSPSLQNAEKADAFIESTAREMWQGMKPGDSGTKPFGKGKIIQGVELASVMDSINLPADVSNIDPETVLWTHRQSDDLDVYFVSNQKLKAMELNPVFRVSPELQPELWYADTGRMEKTVRFQALENGTRVPLELGPAGSVFVVFRKAAKSVSNPVVKVKGPTPLTILAENNGAFAYSRATGNYELTRADQSVEQLQVGTLPSPLTLSAKGWSLEFMPGRDMPNSIELDTLKFWTDHETLSVVHYSGTAGYTTTFEMHESQLAQKDLRFELDLGKVDPMARVWLNGHDLGLLWKPPFTVDVTDHLRAGKNELKVDVTNLWSNRLLAELKYPDGFPGEGERTFKPVWSSKRKFNESRRIQPSGMAGPVQIKPIRKIPLQSSGH
ncbi:glycosyl hydrolase [Pontiellaceae bacterium B12227]|nr:glycosyl hydrolase [Pontiellaceae bacterium B12227]